MTQLKAKILSFIDNPFPIWENDVTDSLVANEVLRLSQMGINLENYNTTDSYLQKKTKDERKNILLSGNDLRNSIYLEIPEHNLLSEFYLKHGLEPELDSKLGMIEVGKLKDALSIFEIIPELKKCISTIVKCIQVLKQFDDEIDTSYSHPEIPFSIFVSLCSSNSVNSNLRVAESILHEAMHLKLTLIEKHIDLIKPNSPETFFSPWRDEQRPIRGVLHGLFVFKTISNFYSEIITKIDVNEHAMINWRINEIYEEMKSIQEFSNNNGLTTVGKKLTLKLLS